MAGVARDNRLQGLQCIRGTYAYSETSGKVLGTLPAGAIVVGASVKVNTAFNAGTTNSLKLGDATTADSVMTTTTLAPATAADKAGILFPKYTADTDIIWTFAQTGTAATAGAAEAVVFYYAQAT